MEDNIQKRLRGLAEYMEASRENCNAVTDFDYNGELFGLILEASMLNNEAVSLRERINEIFHTANSRNRSLFKKEIKEIERLDRTAKEYSIKSDTIAEYVLQQFESVFDF